MIGELVQSWSCYQAWARQWRKQVFFGGGGLRAQRGAVWGGCEQKVSWAGMEVGEGEGGLVEPSPGRWWSWWLSQRPVCGPIGERVGGRRGREGRQTGSVCTLRSVVLSAASKHMAKALGLTREKKIDFHWKNRLEKYLSVCLGAGFSDSKCVMPPSTGDTVKCLSVHLAHCIYDQPQVMMDSPAHIYSYCVHACVRRTLF